MSAKFDIFQKLASGETLWVMAVEGLEEALAQLTRIAKLAPGHYFIFDPRNCAVIATKKLIAKAA